MNISTSLTNQLTRYTNPSEASTMAFILSIGVVGVVSSTCGVMKKKMKRPMVNVPLLYSVKVSGFNVGLCARRITILPRRVSQVCSKGPVSHSMTAL